MIAQNRNPGHRRSRHLHILRLRISILSSWNRAENQAAPPCTGLYNSTRYEYIIYDQIAYPLHEIWNIYCLNYIYTVPYNSFTSMAVISCRSEATFSPINGPLQPGATMEPCGSTAAVWPLEITRRGWKRNIALRRDNLCCFDVRLPERKSSKVLWSANHLRCSIDEVLEKRKSKTHVILAPCAGVVAPVRFDWTAGDPWLVRNKSANCWLMAVKRRNKWMFPKLMVPPNHPF